MGRPLKEVLEAQRKYGYGGNACMICGKPTDSLSIKCESCTEKALYAQQLEQARDWLREHPNSEIELAHDKHRLLHLVLPGCAQLGWCGKPVTQVKSKRTKVVREKFPVGLCVPCLTAYVEASV